MILLTELYDCLDNEWKLWAVKRDSKTLKYLTECKVTTDLMRNFVKKDDWKATYVTLKNSSMTVKMLKQCFRGKNNQKQQVLKMYKNVLGELIIMIDKNK